MGGLVEQNPEGTRGLSFLNTLCPTLYPSTSMHLLFFVEEAIEKSAEKINKDHELH
jgi:hypothetical protein